MQFQPSYRLGLNELVGLAYVQNLGLLMKRAPDRDVHVEEIKTQLYWNKMHHEEQIIN